MKVNIHPTAIIEKGAVLGEGVSIGAFSIIESGVRIGVDCHISERVIIRSGTTLGDRVRVFPAAVLGEEPQHLKRDGSGATVSIGDDTVIREMVTVHRGTELGLNKTVIGKRCFIMAYCHVAHDCVVGDGVIMANSAHLAGHVTVEDNATVGGMTSIVQHCRIGRYSFIGASSCIRKDVPPFLTGKGAEFKLKGINSVGLERQGFSPPTIHRLRSLYRIFFLQHLTLDRAIEKVITELGQSDEINLFLDFVRSSKQGIAR